MPNKQTEPLLEAVEQESDGQTAQDLSRVEQEDGLLRGPRQPIAGPVLTIREPGVDLTSTTRESSGLEPSDACAEDGE